MTAPTFYLINIGHAGDVILTRPFIKELMNTYPAVTVILECVDKYRYLWADLGVQVVTVKEDACEWRRIATEPNFYLFNLHMMAVDELCLAFGISYNTIVFTYNKYLNGYGLYEEYKLPPKRYVPFNTFPARRHLPRVKERAVLVENGAVFSAQSDMDVNGCLQEYAAAFPSLNFYCSAKPLFTAGNVIDISDLNLIEIAEISNACIAFLTRCSGVNAASITERNKYKPRCFAGATESIRLRWFWELPENRTIMAGDKETVFEFLSMVNRHSGTLPYSTADMARHPGKYRVKLENYVKNVSFCKFLISSGEIDGCMEYMRDRMLSPHPTAYENWGLAHILSDLSDGNMLDISNPEAGLLLNVLRCGIPGEKYSMYLNGPMEKSWLRDHIVSNIGDGAALPDGYFNNITCISIPIHTADINTLAREMSRLLSAQGKMYITFKYGMLEANGQNVFDKNGVLRLLEVFEANGLILTDGMNWDLAYPLEDSHYTLGILRFKKDEITP